MNDPDAEDRFIHYPSEIQAMIREFQRTREPALVSPILAGILAKYAPAGGPLNTGGTPEETLGALGFESLTLLEVYLDLQDALGISLSDDDLRGLHSLEEVTTVLVKKVDALREGTP